MSKLVFDPSFFSRASQRYHFGADFVSEFIAQDVEQKMKDHQRQFHKIAIVGSNFANWPARLNLDAQQIEPSETLLFDEEGYDLILHLGALNVTNDVVGQLIQSRLKLKPDGIFIAGFLGGDSLTELRRAIMATDIDIYQGAMMRVSPMIDLRDAGGLLQRAGFALPVADNWKLDVQYKSPLHLVKDLRKMGLVNPLYKRSRTNLTKLYLKTLKSKFDVETACKDTGIIANFELVFLTGYAPSENQPKPRKPGTIQIRLEDALKFKEGKKK